MKTLTLLLLVSLSTACVESSKSNRKPVTTLNPSSPNEATGALRSQLHRIRNTAILTTAQENAAGNDMPTGYDSIPNIFEADDGQGPSSGSVVFASHSSKTCGMGDAFATTQARIDDCLKKNPSQSIWIGRENGNAGEGNWQLVAKNSNNEEVWLDQTTNYLWSDKVAESTGWCEASGNTQGEADGRSVSCATLNPNLRNVCSSSSISILPEAQVLWRLPTRGDFLQADLNGARYVLRNVSTIAYWTATVSGANRDEAWAIVQATGELATASRADGRAIRCIGRRIK